MSGRRKVLRVLLGLLGCGLVLAAAVLLGLEHVRAARLEGELSQAAAALQSLLPGRQPGAAGERAGSAMPAIQLAGRDYIGLLEAPEYGLSLPVLADWEEQPELRPARFGGSVYEGSLVLGLPAGKQLSFLHTMEEGTVFTVTDLYGSVFSYRMERVRRFDSIDAPLLASLPCDLLLFARWERQYLVILCEAG